MGRIVVTRDSKVRTPNWRKWRHVPNVRLWEAVALSLDIEPDLVQWSAGWADGAPIYKESLSFNDRLFVAKRNLSTTRMLEPTMIALGKPEQCEVSLAKFSAWACSIDWEIPQQLAECADQRTELNTAFVPLAEKWPWGDHETELLRKLAAAAHEFWSTYDPEQSSTAPKNEDVTVWLKSKGVSKRVAEVMAQILRADGLPTGPRR